MVNEIFDYDEPLMSKKSPREIMASHDKIINTSVVVECDGCTYGAQVPINYQGLGLWPSDHKIMQIAQKNGQAVVCAMQDCIQNLQRPNEVHVLGLLNTLSRDDKMHSYIIADFSMERSSAEDDATFMQALQNQAAYSLEWLHGLDKEELFAKQFEEWTPYGHEALYGEI